VRWYSSGLASIGAASTAWQRASNISSIALAADALARWRQPTALARAMRQQ